MQPPAVGETHSTTITFTQRNFDEFALLSGDNNPIHVDPGFAARTAFDRTVAHGMALFGVLDAATSQWLGAPMAAVSQELMFTAPTFTDEPVTMDLAVSAASDDGIEVVQRMTRPDGVQTCVGAATRGHLPGAAVDNGPSPARDSGKSFRGLEVGMTAEMTRRYRAADIATYLGLIDDPNPSYRGQRAFVPPPLLGGLISCLLGVELPGPGTNWLKQRYLFHDPVAAGDPVTGRVEIVRLRPEKALVNLRTECTTPRGVAVSGEALVLVADLVTSDEQ